VRCRTLRFPFADLVLALRQPPKPCTN
jgi:hypothetical protein